MNDKVNSFNIAFKKFLNDKELLGDIQANGQISFDEQMYSIEEMIEVVKK